MKMGTGFDVEFGKRRVHGGRHDKQPCVGNPRCEQRDWPAANHRFRFAV